MNMQLNPNYSKCVSCIQR